MNKFAITFFALLTMLLAGCSQSDSPVEGKQYKALPVNLATYRLPQLVEVFSLSCGHCRKMEEALPTIEQLTNQSIGKIHVTFNEGAQISAMIYYAAEMQLGKKPDSEMMAELFSAVQMGPESTGEQKKVAIDAAFQDRGLTSPYDFTEVQQQQLFSAIQLADEITSKAQINGVPTFIVNSKYEIITSGHQSVEEIANTINYLISKP